MLLLRELTREKTGSTHLSSITPTSEDRRQINRIALSPMLLLREFPREKTGSTHVSSVTPTSEDRRQINRIAMSSMLLLHELTREKTGSTHVSSITPASGDRRQVDQRYTKYRQDMIQSLGSSGAAKNPVSSNLILSPQINRIALS
ncbi:hypothetical protein V5799_028811 [Amblyomma americanum]|uniref:Uncharacterized protein n=1 Tax=Amblyomma americanum TaxID=6943 RepID=A0AAQ4DBS4_AMBAM